MTQDRDLPEKVIQPGAAWRSAETIHEEMGPISRPEWCAFRERSLVYPRSGKPGFACPTEEMGRGKGSPVRHDCCRPMMLAKEGRMAKGSVSRMAAGSS